MKHDADVVIVGAAMSGAALAALLANSGLRVVLLDADAPTPFAGGDIGVRVSALGRAAARILDAAGAWRAIEAKRVSPYRAMVIWDAGSDGEVRFDAQDAALPELGWIIENALVQHALLDRVAQAGGVSTRWRAPLEAAEFGDDGVVVRAGGETLRCALLVGADGAHSRVRDLAGIDVHTASYHQRGIVAMVTPTLPHQQTAWQRFLPGGPVALLPLSNGRCSVVWSMPDDEAADMLEADESVFRIALSDATEHRLGPITATGPRAAFPLSRLHAHEYVRPRCALIGDAAHVVHPLAGQGANLGLLDAAALAESLLDAHRAGDEPGSWHALRRYARWRRAHNALTQEVLDGLHRTFGSEHPLIRTLRGAAFRVADGLPWLKRTLALYATGEQGDLPVIARPRP